MEKVRLGRTGLMVTKTSFGALPIQRVSLAEARAILRRACEAGINFFDTARSYSDSEEKIGYSLSDLRKEIYIATKTPSQDKEGVLRDIQTSLKLMKTDYVDLLQLHNPSFLPDPEDPDGMYAGLLEAQRRGYCRFIGITNHRLPLAEEAAKSGKYDTVQYPFNYLSTPEEEALVRLCEKEDVGFIVMKAMSGGLITDASVTFAHLRQFANAVPIYGIQRMEELEQFVGLEENPPVLDEARLATIQKDRKELAGNFCRGCGYCMPCPAGIEIPTAARMSLLLRRSPYQNWLTDSQREAMARIENCLHCNQCSSKCPYQLDTPALLRANWEDYQQFAKEHAE